MKYRHSGILALAVASVLGGCTNASCPERVAAGTGIGAAVGAGLGAIVGSSPGGFNVGQGAAYGAGAGALLGAVAGGASCSIAPADSGQSNWSNSNVEPPPAIPSTFNNTKEK